MLLGITTANEQFCLVIQFHSIIEQSVTLHQAANNELCLPNAFISKDLLRQAASCSNGERNVVFEAGFFALSEPREALVHYSD